MGYKRQVRQRFKSGQTKKTKSTAVFPPITSAHPPDWMLLCLTLSLVVFGWVILYSASAFVAESQFNDQYYFVKKQILWSAIGLMGMSFAFRLNLTFFQRYSWPIFLLALVLLGLVLAVGHEVAGAKRWLRVAGFGVQPSEFAKIAVVLLLADYIDRKKSQIAHFWTGFMPPLVFTGVALGLILLERDVGTPFLIAIVSFGMVFLAGAKYRHLFRIVMMGLPVLLCAIFLVPYRRERIMAFLDPWQHAQGTGYQLVQSLLALGSGGFWGRGSGESTIKMHYLPETQTDFVFPILGEEFGFLGAVILIGVFFFLVLRCTQVASRATHSFGFMVSAGVGFLLGGQVLINLGVVTGLLPTKGMPLPFISFGGSSIVSMLTAVGLVLNVSRQPGKPVMRSVKKPMW